VIPVELVSFEAERKNSVSELTWITATEINNSHFDVERSVDGERYEVVGKVDGNGTTTNEQTYSYTDTRPVNGKNYYRLAQYDFDGTMTHTAVRVVSFESLAATNEIVVYPNPVVEYVVIESSNEIEPITVQIYNVTGALVIETKQETGTQIDMSQLPSGQYTVKAFNANRYHLGTKQITKVTK